MIERVGDRRLMFNGETAKDGVNPLVAERTLPVTGKETRGPFERSNGFNRNLCSTLCTCYLQVKKNKKQNEVIT